MSRALPEPRTPVMIVVEATWADQNGVLQAVSACVEDKSAGGACIRTKTPIGVGSRLRVQGRWERISGTAKYCRRAGNDYLVGIQRDPAKNLIADQPIPAVVPIREEPRSTTPPVPLTRVQNQPEPLESKAVVILVPVKVRQEVGIVTTAMTLHPAIHKIDGNDRSAELQMKQPTQEKEPGKERKSMQRKWSELIHRHSKQDEFVASGSGNSNGKAVEGLPLDSEEGIVNFHVELLPVEDIYRTAGIANLRRGYSIGKVVEMLHSEHGRGLSKDAKRAAVLMALDAAGIPVNEVLQDAKARQDALASYEAEVRKGVEAEWAKKAEENVQIQAELERVKAHFMARISRNQDGVAREKAIFNNWLSMKQQESQSIAEATELCSKSSVPELASGSLPAISMAAAGAKPV